ncbi:MAG: CobD/CbiB family cobalamin biosynthesis protein [Thermoproteus sp. AZ2]|uniref:CobD/CbiB family cobalamin biosynthesis protein n=1 Tax=Thermoproteus sp. AZ2 TaxID=1609232 RepID=A0ACC6V1Z5_9CREN|nr:MAG: cobalamin biosynthesis protein CbiB [Thermoproteus sp. AZ2]
MGSPLVLAIALLLELIDVPRLWRGHLVSRLVPPQIHPVALIYRGAAKIARRGSLARNIAALLAFAAGPALAVYYAERALGHGIIAAAAEAYLLKLAFSESQILYPCRSAFRRGPAKPVVQEFVRRDLSNASPGHIASACLETAAESLADSFISPLFWYAVLGLPGAWLQRAVNTLDGLMGFKEWGRSGAPAAYLDTALNYIPARLAALFIYAASAALGIRPRPRRPGEMESINARWPISALAYSLGVRLEKPGSYSIGSGELPTTGDALRGLKVLAAAAALYSAALLLILYMGLS